MVFIAGWNSEASVRRGRRRLLEAEKARKDFTKGFTSKQWREVIRNERRLERRRSIR